MKQFSYNCLLALEREKEKKKYAKPFYYRVWEINKQCTGLKSKNSYENFLS
jgi:hypothetical protein